MLKRNLRILMTVLILPCFGQNLHTDSLSLVDFYTQCNGSNWVQQNSWLTGPVASWQGVTVNNNRVEVLSLPSNNISGTLPSSFCQLTALKYLYLSGNGLSGNLPSCFGNLTALNSIDFTGNKLQGPLPAQLVTFPQLADLWVAGNDFDDLPDLSGLLELANVDVRFNKLHFEDIIPNIGILNFQYAPQDTLYFNLDTTVNLRDTFFLKSKLDGDSFSWKFANTIVNENVHYDLNADSIWIRYALFPDSGYYQSFAQHSAVPGLTLVQAPIRVHIFDNRLIQHPVLVSNASLCGAPLVKLKADSEVNPVSVTLIAGPGQLNTDTTLQPNTPGSFTIRLSNGGNDYYKPIQKDTTIVVVEIPQEVNHTFIRPKDPGDLFSASFFTDGTVKLISVNPALDSAMSNGNFEVINFQEKDQGVYQFFIQTNGCSWYSESYLIELDKTIRLYELVTPNGDGKNETLLIGGLWNQKENHLKIFNAYQQLVYATENYQNDWSGDTFPDGSYYFTLALKSGEILKGQFQLRRE